MFGFWILVALLLLAAYALFFPFLSGRGRRNETDRQKLNLMLHRQRRDELAREAATDDPEGLAAELDQDLLADLSRPEHHVEATPGKGRGALLAALAVAPIVAFGLYSQLGRLDLADFSAVAEAEHKAAGGPQAAGDFQTMIDRLAERLKNQPNDIQGWMLLARSYHETQQYDKAVETYEHVLQVAPDNLDAKGFYADSMGRLNGSFQGKPLEIATEILKTNPKHANGLWVAAQAAAETGDSKKALTYLQKLKALFPKDSEDAKQLTKIIAQVQGGGAPMQAAEQQAEAQESTTASGGDATQKSIRVKVSLAADLKKKAGADETVFIFARAASGPPMPLAIVRKKVKELPVEVTLDDSMAMVQGMNLSSFEQLVIGARVSKTGQALPSPGDLQGLTEPVAVQSGKTYAVQISKVVE